MDFTLSSCYRLYKFLTNEIFINKNEVSIEVIDMENKLIQILDSKDLNINIDLNSNLLLNDNKLEKDINDKIDFLRKNNFFYISLIFESVLKGYIFLKENGGNNDGTKYIIAKSL